MFTAPVISSPTFQISKPPSPPTPTIPPCLRQSTLKIFFPSFPSHTFQPAIGLFTLRKSHNRTTPSYAPLTSWCEPLEGEVVMQDGVEGCRRLAEADVTLDDDERRSYTDIVRSVDDERRVFPSADWAKSSIGFS